MIRKPPLRTYQRKQNALTSFAYSQASLCESRSYSKKVSACGKKNKPLLTQDHRDVEDISSDYLDSTFDKIAKNARLPPVPQQETYSSLEISSDIPDKEPSPIKPGIHELSAKIGSSKAKTSKRPKRKAAQNRAANDDSDAIAKKRLKHDLINLSTKKAKAVRNTRRKVSAKTLKNVQFGKVKVNNDVQELKLNYSDEWLVGQPVKSNVAERNSRKQKNGYTLRRRNNVIKTSNSSLSNSDCSRNHEADISKMKTKPKNNVASDCDPSKKKMNTFDSIDTVLNGPSGFSRIEVKDDECFFEKFQDKQKESFLVNSHNSVNTTRFSDISNRTRNKVYNRSSPALDYVTNFRRYSELQLRKSTDSESVGSRKWKRILPEKPTLNNINELASGNLKLSEICKNDETSKQEFPIKPCSVLLVKYNEKKFSVLRKKKSKTTVRNMHSTTDIFQSTNSMTSSSFDPQADKPMRITSQESEESQRGNDLNQDRIQLSVITTGHSSHPTVRRRAKSDTNRSLYYLKCSTPINTHVIIDKSMNCLSPIAFDDETCPRIEKIVDDEGVAKCLDVKYNQQHSEVQKLKTCRQRARKKLSISFEKDESLVIDDEQCNQNEILKPTDDNVKIHDDSLPHNKSDKIQSPTSEIQVSLEVLKLNLENSVNKYCIDNDDKERRSLLKETGIVSIGSKESSDIFESMNTCSQLTPTGILTTRSGRQLRLSNSMHKKFFNDSEHKADSRTSKIPDDDDAESDCDIVEASEVGKKRIPLNQINTNRGSKFPVSESHSQSKLKDSTCHISEPHIPNDSSFHELMGLNSQRKMQTISVNSCSQLLTRDNEISSVLDDNSSNARKSDIRDAKNESTVSSTQRMLDSMMESIKSLGSLEITSQGDVKENSRQNSGHEDNNSSSEWDTLSSNEDATNELKSEHSADTATDNTNSDSEWNTLSSNNVDAIKSNEECKATNFPSRLSKSLENFYGNKGNDNRSNQQALNQSPEASVSSPELTDMSLNEKKELFSCRITTRKRRKTFLKPLEKIDFKTIEDQVVIQDCNHSSMINSVHSRSGSNHNLLGDNKTESVEDPLDLGTDANLFKHPSHINLCINLQPLVLVEKLEDPLRIATNNKQNYGLDLTPIHEISNEILSQMPNYSSQLRIAGANEIIQNNKDFEKFRDPLHLPPRRSKRSDKKQTNINKKSKSDSVHRVSKLNLRKSEKPREDSMSTHFHDLDERPKRNSLFKANKSSPFESKTHVSKLNVSDSEKPERQSLFLKPGKDWTRSLSILNNIQNGTDLEQLSSGKGKNWRMSVQALLDMQQQQQNIKRVVQSCLGKNGDDKETQPCFKALNCTAVPDTVPCSEEPSIDSASPGRFIRRMSIRVVPDNKRLTHIENSSFLEAYGITPSKSRKSLTRRSKLQRKQTLVPDLQSENVAIEALNTEQEATPRDVVLQQCSQDDYLPFMKCFPADYLEHCTKIGEGVYGEVFFYEYKEDRSVIKIIPIEGNALVNGERQKRFDEILSEIVIAKELHDLRNGEQNQTHGFVEVKNIRCICGKYPDTLIELWKAYDNEKGSENDCPSMFDDNQLYIVLELGHGGQDLEAFVFHSAIEAHALFVQTAFALAVAEQSLEFEHRDLHWGNVLISETKKEEVAYKLNGREYLYPTKGLQVAIIDFTLSRMSYDGCCIFNDLALDPALFTAQGEYQFEIYRLMKDKVGNDWQQFEPYTNLLWLHYTIDKMMTAARYKRKYAKGHREALFWFHELKDEILNYKSAFDFVTNCEKITNFKITNCNRTTETTASSNETKHIEIDPRK